MCQKGLWGRAAEGGLVGLIERLESYGNISLDSGVAGDSQRRIDVGATCLTLLLAIIFG